jgi:hypothetical protein
MNQEMMDEDVFDQRNNDYDEVILKTKDMIENFFDFENMRNLP